MAPGGDHADPLAQRGLVGWKGMWGLKTNEFDGTPPMGPASNIKAQRFTVVRPDHLACIPPGVTPARGPGTARRAGGYSSTGGSAVAFDPPTRWRCSRLSRGRCVTPDGNVFPPETINDFITEGLADLSQYRPKDAREVSGWPLDQTPARSPT